MVLGCCEHNSGFFWLPRVWLRSLWDKLLASARCHARVFPTVCLCGIKLAWRLPQWKTRPTVFQQCIRSLLDLVKQWASEQISRFNIEDFDLWTLCKKYILLKSTASCTKSLASNLRASLCSKWRKKKAEQQRKNKSKSRFKIMF